MSDSSPLVPTEVATSISGFTTPDTQGLIPAMDGANNTLALMPPIIDGQRKRHQVAHPGNVPPTLTRQLAGNPATPVPTGPSLTVQSSAVQSGIQRGSRRKVNLVGSNGSQTGSKAKTPASKSTTRSCNKHAGTQLGTKSSTKARRNRC